MKRPSFQFYPADWKANAKLRRCSDAARGVWMDVLCTLHDSDEYGVVRYPLAELARAAGASLKLVKELVDRNVLKGADTGQITHTHIPRHAGKSLPPVTLIEGPGPIWFSSRMVLDEWHRTRRGASTRFGATPSQSPTPRKGDGATSPSTSPSEKVNSTLRVEARPRAKARRSLPEDFPLQADRDWALAHWLAKGRADLCDAIAEEIAKFRDHHTGKATMSADWPGSWRTWTRNAMNFTRRPAPIAFQTATIHKVA